MLKVLVVGDRPKTPTSQPFENARCKARLLDWLSEMGVKDYELANQTDTDIGIKIMLHEGPVIALGNNAAKRIRSLGFCYFKLPHPSAKSRLLNDKDFVAYTLKECSRWLRGGIGIQSIYPYKIKVGGSRESSR